MPMTWNLRRAIAWIPTAAFAGLFLASVVAWAFSFEDVGPWHGVSPNGRTVVACQGWRGRLGFVVVQFDTTLEVDRGSFSVDPRLGGILSVRTAPPEYAPLGVTVVTRGNQWYALRDDGYTIWRWVGFGLHHEDFPGYRLWQAQCPYWFFCALFAWLAAIRIRSALTPPRRADRAAAPCTKCGYDLRVQKSGLAGDKCPECGTPIPASPVSPGPAPASPPAKPVE
jgi:hypothetical protein